MTTEQVPCEPVLPGYAILAKLGEGSMLTIHLTRHSNSGSDESGKKVAIKMPLLESPMLPGVAQLACMDCLAANARSAQIS